ncbi:hypothetical protein GUJ93_ZPchr0010g9955 [Zizania palustris]|nr:hypothetical protein GUJ93_ZPchr0010g9955 [Zizania palustris]
MMDRLVQRLVSACAAAAATVWLLYLLLRHVSASFVPAPHALALSLVLLPGCAFLRRRLARPRSSPRWRRRRSSAAAVASSAFAPIRGLRLQMDGSSRVLSLAAGASHAVDALHSEG